MDKNGEGLIHIYTGDGKGKTTAAIGLCIRMVGNDKKVMFAQFMKGMDSSEREPLAKLGVHVLQMGSVKKFVPDMTSEEKRICKQEQNLAFEYMKAHAKEYDLVVLDELISAITTEMIEEEAVVAFLQNKPIPLEVVLTGRTPPKNIITLAHYISEIAGIKHPYEQGIQARKGIEF